MARNIVQVTATMQQRFTSNGGTPFSTSYDDSTINKQIQSTHSHDGHEVDVKPIILNFITDVLNRANLSMDSVISGTSESADVLVEKTPVAGLAGQLKEYASSINKISCELSCQCSGGEDPHATTMAIINNLSNYSWDAKVVICLSAFAVYYGEFCLIARLSTTNPLAKSVSLLKQLPDIVVNANSLKSRIDTIKNLLKAIQDVTECVFKFKEFPPQYISHETLATAMARFPLAAYWTIRGMVACSSQINILLGMSYEHITPTTEALEVSRLAHKFTNIQNDLNSQLEIFRAHIEEEKHYNKLIRLFEMTHVDNMRILKELIYFKDEKKPLLDGSIDSSRSTSKKRVGIEEALLGKTVVLLISNLDIAEEELFTLKQAHHERKTRPDLKYEIVWIPVVDKSTPSDEANRKKFEQLQEKMPWYTVVDPWLLDPVVVRYIKEVWHFSKKLILVVLDPQGKVVCNNALHMFRVWGNAAFPFTTAREELLWKDDTWKNELLVDSIDPTIVEWISQGKLICLYGGVDIEWIREFNTTAKALAKTSGISLEMVYLGESKAKERVKKITSTITAEKLGHCLPYPTYTIPYFWTRLESIWHSRTQHGKTAKNDRILQEISAILSFDGGDQGWAIISQGSTEMVRANSDTVVNIFKDYKLSAEETKQKGGFLRVHKEIVEKWRQIHGQEHHCNKLILPWTGVGIPETLLCADCERPMEKYFLYRCCTD